MECLKLHQFKWRHRQSNKIWHISKLSQQNRKNINKLQKQLRLSKCKNKAQQASLSILSIVTCFIGCSIHIWYISEIYFKYDVTTSNSFGTFDNFELPAITVCMSLTRTFSKEKWLHRFPTEGSQMGNKIPAELSIAEIDDMGPDLQKDRMVGYFVSDGFYLEELQPWRSNLKSIHLDHNLKCQTFFLRIQDNSNISYSETTIIIRLTHLHKTYPPYRAYVHSSGEKFHLGRYHAQKEFLVMQERRSLDAQLAPPTSTTLLPAPYKTNCFNYASRQDPHILNRADCMHNCLATWNRKVLESNEWPSFLTIYLGDNLFNWTALRIAAFGYTDRWSQANALLKANERHCQRHDCAKPDCLQNYVSMSMIKDEVYSVNSTSILKIHFPSEPTRVHTWNPKMEFVEYLCYVGGVLSLWLGISAFSFITHLRTKFQELYRTRKKHDI